MNTVVDVMLGALVPIGPERRKRLGVPPRARPVYVRSGSALAQTRAINDKMKGVSYIALPSMRNAM